VPELPEVETIRRDLERTLVGRLLVDFEIYDTRLMNKIDQHRWRENALSQRWKSLERRGKYLIVGLAHNWRIVFHLRMTGQLVLNPASGSVRPRMLLSFDDASTLAFVDQRRFGEVWLLSPEQSWPSKVPLGPDALDELNEKAFIELVKKRTTRIQPLLMDQRLISGIGNIYAQEALFKALIRPSRPGWKVTRNEAIRLFGALQETLQSAIEHRGSTSRNYRDAYGQTGFAQTLHAVYRKGGRPCPRCETPLTATRVGGERNSLLFPLPAMRRKPLKQKPLVVGLTGGIATGKSEVLKLFKEIGFMVVSSDELAHQCIRRGQPAYRKIIREFGPGLLDRHREIDRQALGKVVFASPPSRRRLEKIIHPYVIKSLQTHRSRNKGLLVLDIPLLFEARLQNLVDRIVVVYAGTNQQVERLIRHRKLTRNEALQRIHAQWPLSKKCLEADYVLGNTATRAELKLKTRQLLKGWNRAKTITLRPISSR